MKKEVYDLLNKIEILFDQCESKDIRFKDKYQTVTEIMAIIKKNEVKKPDLKVVADAE